MSNPVALPKTTSEAAQTFSERQDKAVAEIKKVLEEFRNFKADEATDEELKLFLLEEETVFDTITPLWHDEAVNEDDQSNETDAAVKKAYLRMFNYMNKSKTDSIKKQN